MMSMTCHCDIRKRTYIGQESVADMTFSYKKKIKNSENDICFLFRLAYNSGFLCKFAVQFKTFIIWLHLKN